jgi:hypothetical protein
MNMKKTLNQRLIGIGAGAVLIVGLIYGYSYTFKNKTISEAVPTSKQTTTAKSQPSNTTTQPTTTSPMPTTPAPTPTPAASPQVPPSTTSTIATGNFRSAPGERADGTVHLIKVDGTYYVRFEADTDIGASPDPIVTFGNGDRADVSINLGSLKGTKGSQNYEVPASIDTSKYSQVIIYCRAFHVPIGYADLTR